MQTVKVDLGQRSYNIFVGERILSSAGDLLKGAGIKGKVAVVTNPTVAQLYLDSVHEALKSSGFKAIRVDSYSDDVAEGRVASVEPGEGQSIPEGSEINLYVSIGPEFEKLTMPDVRNLPLDDASATLRNKGLRIDVVQSCGGNGTMVVDTDPVAGVTVRENDVVALFVC